LEKFTNHKSREWIKTEGIIPKMTFLLSVVESIWVKASDRGVLHLHKSTRPLNTPNTISIELPPPHVGHLVLAMYPALEIPSEEMVSTTGAGDTLVGGLVAGLMSKEQDEAVWVGRALERVGRTIRSRRAVG